MKVPIHNPGDSPMYVGGRMILPGETEHVDATLLPPEHRPAAEVPEAPAEVDPLAELQAQPAKAVIAALDELDVVKLQRLAALEEAAEKPRKTVLEAIAAAHLAREAARVGGGE